MTHTPGPWLLVVQPKSKYAAVRAGSRNETAICSCPATGRKETLEQHERRIKQSFANARLIAAAPELLKSLERVLELAIGHASDAGHDRDHLETVSWVKNARAAIAKAKGEEQ